MERQSISGKFIENAQKRYIQNRISWGAAREKSSSEPILYHLRTKGIVRGLPSALVQSFREFGPCAPILLPLGVIEFSLIASGIRLFGLEEDGRWKLG